MYTIPYSYHLPGRRLGSWAPGTSGRAHMARRSSGRSRRRMAPPAGRTPPGACGGRSRSRGSGAGTPPRAAARSRSHQPYHRLHIYNRSLSRDDTRWAHKTSIIDLHQLYLAKQTYMWIPCPRSLPPGRMRHTGRRTPGSLYERWLPRWVYKSHVWIVGI